MEARGSAPKRLLSGSSMAVTRLFATVTPRSAPASPTLHTAASKEPVRSLAASAGETIPADQLKMRWPKAVDSLAALKASVVDPTVRLRPSKSEPVPSGTTTAPMAAPLVM